MSSSMPSEARFNLNFSNPGGSAPFESLLLSPRQMVSDKKRRLRARAARVLADYCKLF